MHVRLSSGTLITVGTIALKVENGKLTLSVPSGQVAQALACEPSAWRSVTLAWKGLNVSVYCDNVMVLSARLRTPLQLPGMGHGLQIRDQSPDTEPATVVLGPMPAIIDNLRMSTVATVPIIPSKSPPGNHTVRPHCNSGVRRDFR